MRNTILLGLLVATPVAAQPGPEAQPFVERGDLGGGAGLTFDHFANAFLSVDGSVKLDTAPLWLRGSAGYGSTGDFEGGGRFVRGLVGVETRTCGGVACGFAGIELGAQRQTWESIDEPTEQHHGFLYGGRFGLDAGGDYWRFRATLELYRYARRSDVMALPDSSDGGGGLSLSVLRRL